MCGAESFYKLQLLTPKREYNKSAMNGITSKGHCVENVDTKKVFILSEGHKQGVSLIGWDCID